MTSNLEDALESPAVKATLGLVAAVSLAAFIGSVYWIGDLLRLVFQPIPGQLRSHFPDQGALISRVAWRSLPAVWAGVMCVTAVSVIRRRPNARQALELTALAGIAYQILGFGGELVNATLAFPWLWQLLSLLIFKCGLLAAIVVLLRSRSVRTFCDTEVSPAELPYPFRTT